MLLILIFQILQLKKQKINRSGNDCFDFSGGQYVVTNATLINCKDKAVSVGEKSKAYLSNIYVNHTKFGIVSKDKSITNVEGATLKNCDIAFSAYRKKQEFGGGILQYSKVNNYCSKLKENDRLSEILSRN